MISDEYRQQLQEKHASDEAWGTTSYRYADLVRHLIKEYGITDILDYGCGKGAMKKSLGMDIREYDPGIPQKSKKPKPAQMVVCTDVLEHVEPNYLKQVLDDLQRVTKRVLLLDVCVVKAVHTLPDGRNAHLIVEDMNWWLPKIIDRFKIKVLQDAGSNFFMVLEPL